MWHGLFPSEKLTTPLANDNAWRRHIGPKLAAIGLGWVNFHCEIPLVVNARSGGGSESCGHQQGHTLNVNLNVYTETSLERRIEAAQQFESAMVNGIPLNAVILR